MFLPNYMETQLFLMLSLDVVCYLATQIMQQNKQVTWLPGWVCDFFGGLFQYLLTLSW
jgi:hypothetical protein